MLNRVKEYSWKFPTSDVSYTFPGQIFRIHSQGRQLSLIDFVVKTCTPPRITWSFRREWSDRFTCEFMGIAWSETIGLNKIPLPSPPEFERVCFGWVQGQVGVLWPAANLVEGPSYSSRFLQKSSLALHSGNIRLYRPHTGHIWL